MRASKLARLALFGLAAALQPAATGASTNAGSPLASGQRDRLWLAATTTNASTTGSAQRPERDRCSAATQFGAGDPSSPTSHSSGSAAIGWISSSIARTSRSSTSCRPSRRCAGSRPSRIQRRTVSGLRPTRAAVSRTVSMKWMVRALQPPQRSTSTAGAGAVARAVVLPARATTHLRATRPPSRAPATRHARSLSSTHPQPPPREVRSIAWERHGTLVRRTSRSTTLGCVGRSSRCARPRAISGCRSPRCMVGRGRLRAARS